MRVLIALLLLAPLAAEDITTLDGKTYADVTIDKVVPEGVVIVLKGRKQGIKFTDLPPELAFKYRCEGAMRTAAAAKTTVKKGTDGFALADLEAAKKKAAAEGKPIGFLMCWDRYFDAPTGLTTNDGAAALAHFVHVFKDQMVLVFVSHERELGQVPAAVKKGFNGPDEGGYAPNMCVVDPKVESFIVEIPVGDKAKGVPAKDLVGREDYFRAGIAKIVAAKDLWALPPKPAEDAKSEKKKPAK